nr:hypothetical protein BaRGS_029462 [Batillaria attramentaria]
MFIRFHTDSVINANSNGFTATYKAMKKGKRRKTELAFHCASQMMTASEGNFTSPGFPSQYPRDTYCIWTITVHPGYAIEATFDEFSVGRLSATECMDAYVRVVKQGRYSDVNFQPDNEKGEATFQLALITDGVTSYALVYYLTGAMTWTYRGHWSYVIMGVSDGTGDNYQLSMYSKTSRAYVVDSFTGNTGRKGIWIYKVGEVPASPEQLCQQWFSRNIILKSDRTAFHASCHKYPGVNLARELRHLRCRPYLTFTLQGRMEPMELDGGKHANATVFTAFATEENVTRTRGLLGNFNGIKNDEFVLPDGRILSDNMTDRQLHNNFGQQFPPADKKSAEKVCGVANNACIYDYITTGDKNFAASTNQTNQQATQDNHQINNTLPEVTVPANVTVTPGQTVTITVNAKDPDPGDVATFGLLDNANGKLSINQQTGNLTINTSSLEPIEPQ